MIGALLAKRAIADGFKAMNQHDLSRFMAKKNDFLSRFRYIYGFENQHLC